MNSSSRPKVAVIDTNTLAVLGLKQLLLNIMPIITVDTFGSMTELEANQPDAYMHYFVSLDIAARPSSLPSPFPKLHNSPTSIRSASTNPSHNSSASCCS